MSAPPYPWQQAAWERIRAMRRNGRLPHALLVSCPPGTGTRAFAEHVASSLLCGADADQAPCGACAACQQYQARTHPDALWLEPEETGKAIRVDAVRELVDRLRLTPGRAGKTAIIDPADAMNTSAANSLLKTLEEPPGDSVLMLVSRRPARLPATVRSRCQRISFGLPGTDVALAWLHDQGVEAPGRALARAGGRPLAALEWSRADHETHDAVVDALLVVLEQGAVPPQAIAAGGGLPLSESVPLMVAAAEDLVRVVTAGRDTQLRFPEHAERFAALAGRVDARGLFDYLRELYGSIPGPSASLRGDIQFEGLLSEAASMVLDRERKAGGT